MIAEAIRARRTVVAAAVGLAVVALLVGARPWSARAPDEKPGLDMPPIACTAEQRYASASASHAAMVVAAFIDLAGRDLRWLAVEYARWKEQQQLEELGRWLHEQCAREHEGGYLRSPAC